MLLAEAGLHVPCRSVLYQPTNAIFGLCVDIASAGCQDITFVLLGKKTSSTLDVTSPCGHLKISSWESLHRHGKDAGQASKVKVEAAQSR